MLNLYPTKSVPKSAPKKCKKIPLKVLKKSVPKIGRINASKGSAHQQDQCINRISSSAVSALQQDQHFSRFSASANQRIGKIINSSISAFRKYIVWCVVSGHVTIYRAVQLIQMFGTHGQTVGRRDGHTDQGVPKSPRGPENCKSVPKKERSGWKKNDFLRIK